MAESMTQWLGSLGTPISPSTLSLHHGNAHTSAHTMEEAAGAQKQQCSSQHSGRAKGGGWDGVLTPDEDGRRGGGWVGRGRDPG